MKYYLQHDSLNDSKTSRRYGAKKKFDDYEVLTSLKSKKVGKKLSTVEKELIKNSEKKQKKISNVKMAAKLESYLQQTKTKKVIYNIVTCRKIVDFRSHLSDFEILIVH